MNAEGLKAEVLAAVQEYNLDRSHVVALVLDNVSYGEVAYDSLQSNEPGFSRLIKIGCIAHVLNLMATAYTQRAYFPHTNTLLDQLRKILCTKHGKLGAKSSQRGSGGAQVFSTSWRRAGPSGSTR